jgi:hypothetical protein
MRDPKSRVPPSVAARTGKGHAARSTTTWVVLLAISAGLYVRAPAFGGAYVGFIVLVFVLTVVRFRRQGRRFVADNAKGLAAIARGDLGKAHDLFWQWAEGTKVPRISAIARHNLGWTLMRQGDVKGAIEVLSDNEDRNRAHYGPSACSQRAQLI